MKRKKILICGATGFIGRNLVEHFAKQSEYEVIAVSHRTPPFASEGITWIRADLTNPSQVHEIVQGTYAIIQAAATTSGAKDIVTKPFYHVTDNAVMNSLLLRAAYEHSVPKFLFFSCTVMYPSSDVPLRETDFDANAEMYKSYFGVGWTKVYIEKMCEFYSRLGRTQHTVLRHSNIYGPHDKYDLERSHVFGATVTKVMTATNGAVTVWGEGKEKRDLLYISDLVDCVALALEKQATPFELFNVGLGEAISVADLVKKIIRASGRDLVVEYDRTKPTLSTQLCLEISKVNRAIGWRPSLTLDEGIAKTMTWYQQEFLSPKK